MMAADNALVDRLIAIRLVVTDLDRAIAFYRDALGLVLDSSARDVASLRLGDMAVELARVGPAGSAYPEPRAANDPWFQHFAIRVTDMAAAFAQLALHAQHPISTGGPQQLPPSTGSVIAYKFRDPDGHPLELSFVPGGPPPGASVSPIAAIDHSGIAVADLTASLAFYVGQLGLRETARLVNTGPAQARLDGLTDPCVDIVVLQPAGGGPHLELLHYRTPLPAPARVVAAGDIAATRLRFTTRSAAALTAVLARHAPVAGSPGLIRDPDGHLIELR